MAMEYKAYAFDWSAFEVGLKPLLVEALGANDTAKLQAFINQHLGNLTDPYEGDPLSADWKDTLENSDVHEYGDYALTRYYDPADNRGIGYEWVRLSEELAPPAAHAMLGFASDQPNTGSIPGAMGHIFRRRAKYVYH